MFILEESQLLEDTIKDSNVLNLYRALRNDETSNNRLPFITNILTSEQCNKLSNLILEFYQSNGYSITEPTSSEHKFSLDQRKAICEQLNLQQEDVAALALVISATLTQLFVIDNFVGPTSNQIIQDSYQNLPDPFQALQTKVGYRSLTRDGSEVHHQIVNPWLLRVVQLYWSLLNSFGCSRKLLELEYLVWKHRYLTVYLMVLLEPSELLVNELRKIQEFIFDHHILNEAKENNTQLVRFNTIEICCELLQSSLLRDGVSYSRKFFDYASELSGITVEHTGVLGKRTRFQQKNVPQLVVKIIKDQEKIQNDEVLEDKLPTLDDLSDLPKDVRLNDDTLLPDISFVTSNENGESTCTKQNLKIEAQMMLLANLDITIKSEVMEESLKDEWTQAYLRSIIDSASTWPIKCKVLALRSLVEKKHMRKMDRALLQIEELVKADEKINSKSNQRLRTFYSVLPPSRWQMQRNLGDMSFDLGLFKNALDMYLRIQYWEGIIKCYCALDQTVKAEKIIRQELEKQETPYMLCLLGDATDDIEHYEKSWSLSKGRFARAKKSIGTYFYVRKEYDKAIENYELALGANPTNISILSLLGYSCLIMEKYERAAECYRNITYNDDTNFLAWNNLSKAYIKLDQKERAWRTLREAIKCNYEEWKIWENFMIVSIEIGALDDVIMAWHRLIDIKSSHKDEQVLSALTHALIEMPNDKVDSAYSKLLSEALKLVSRINATSDCSPRLWICYFKLLIKEFELFKIKSVEPAKLDVDSRISKITNALQRATPNSLTTETDWSPGKIDKLLDSYNELSECYQHAMEITGSRPEIERQWKYFKLAMNNAKKTLEAKGYK